MTKEDREYLDKIEDIIKDMQDNCFYGEFGGVCGKNNDLAKKLLRSFKKWRKRREKR